VRRRSILLSNLVCCGGSVTYTGYHSYHTYADVLFNLDRHIFCCAIFMFYSPHETFLTMMNTDSCCWPSKGSFKVSEQWMRCVACCTACAGVRLLQDGPDGSADQPTVAFVFC
jgi:hypothetical protein